MYARTISRSPRKFICTQEWSHVHVGNLYENKKKSLTQENNKRNAESILTAFLLFTTLNYLFLCCFPLLRFRLLLRLLF